MKQYHKLLKHVLENGIRTPDRTGTGILFCDNAPVMKFDLQEGFPLVTTKKMFTTGIIDELLWFVKGSTNALELPERTQKWWTPWMKPDGELGPIYGKQLRNQEKLFKDGTVKVVDQLQNVIDSIKNDPWSRRHIISLWSSLDVEEQQLPCCHGSIIQFFVKPDEDGKPKFLSCKMYQRSGDVFIGVPVNIASYSVFLMMIAQVTNLIPENYIHVLGNAHIYSNHIEQVKIQLTRECMSLPRMILNPDIKNINEFRFEDFKLENYKSHSAIKGDVAI